MQPKVLFLTTPAEDYLQDQLLTGMRHLLGTGLVDWPRKGVLYRDCPRPASELYGRGFTLWKQLEDIEVDRSRVGRRMRRGEFDLVVFGNIRGQKLPFLRFLASGGLGRRGTRVCCLDGRDGTRAYRPALLAGPYYKREQDGDSPASVRSIGFSIPEAKLRRERPEKTKRFARQVQCPEAYRLDEVRRECTMDHVFDQERDYYDDLARSRYGVTMRKGGWDCMRHYEIAANHAVPLFYRLADKPGPSAPHGLTDMVNVVAFDTAAELVAKLERIERESLYEGLCEAAADWAADNTCQKVAARLLGEVLGERSPQSRDLGR